MAETRGKSRMDTASRGNIKKQKTDSEPEATGESSFEEFLKQVNQKLSLDEVRETLELNEQLIDGTDEEIYRRCADQMFYGPLEACILCKGGMEFNGSEFRCLGYFTEWTKCNFSTKEDRTKHQQEWKVPEKTHNSFLKEWKKSQAGRKRPERKVPAEEAIFHGMKISLEGRMTRTHHKYKEEIEKYGGKIIPGTKGATCLVIPDAELSGGGSLKLADAMEQGQRVIQEAWLRNCLAMKKRLPFDDYDVSTVLPTESAVKDTEDYFMAEIKLAGKRHVHKDSGFVEGAHIYEQDGIIYNCAFALCDIAGGLNHFAILELIKLDDGTLYLFRKRGRAGDLKDVDELLEEQQDSDKGIREFVKHFEDLTGNEFEPWERFKQFHKRPKKFFPIDMNIGYDACAGALHPRQVAACAAHTTLDPHIAELCKLLFNQETYRFAISEYGHLVPDLPQGNVTEFHVHRCEDVLRGFAKYLKETKDDERKRELTCLDKSNRWHSLMYSIRPMVLSSLLELAEIAAPALECARDISVASQFIGNMTGETSLDDPFADRYAKLNYKFRPIDREGPDFEMIRHYLQKTYEPVVFEDVKYGVTINHVYEVDCPDRTPADKRSKKFLLWCGARTACLLRWLHKGVVPAIFEAPAPGYLFGRGIYCTDTATKAASFGFTSLDKPDGVLMLAVVSMGEKILELPKPEKDVREYEKARADIKVLGRRTTNKSEFQTWKENVIVPCGSLVDSNVKDSILDYNEYVAYDPKQVKLSYLVSVRYDEI